MERRILADTELEVSRICLGTMTFGGQVEAGEAKVMLDWALDQGVNFVDTANNYTGGESERLLGKGLQGRRDSVVLASKVFNKFGDGSDQRGLSRPAIHRGLEASLQRLKTDYLDIYYFHAPDYDVPLEESLRAMDELVRSGKVRYVGVSNYASWQLTQLHWIAEREGLPVISLSQPMYNLIARGIESEYLPACRELGVANVVYNPLAGGLLTGKHPAEEPVDGSRFATNQQYVARYWSRDNHAAVQRLTKLAAGVGRSLVSLAYNWLLHHTQVDGIVVGASQMGHLTSNIAVLNDGALPEEIVTECDQVWGDLRGPTPQYNR